MRPHTHCTSPDGIVHTRHSVLHYTARGRLYHTSYTRWPSCHLGVPVGDRNGTWDSRDFALCTSETTCMACLVVLGRLGR